MRPILLLALFASLAACSSSGPGACSRDSDCPAGAACDAQQHVCVTRAGACFPACSTGQQCDAATSKCVAVTQPDVTLSAPASGDVADGTLAVAATAHAPGGVTALSFEVRSTAGALLASAPGVAAASDPASFSATVRLAGVADGSAIVQAVITYGSAQTRTSAAVQILLDQRPPSITLQTDGRVTLLAGGQTATVTAQIGDGPGTGVVDSSVVLRIASHADVPGTGVAGVYTFSIPIDDSIAASGTSATVPFQIAATDRQGHTATTAAGDPRAVLRADRDAPQIAGIAVITPAPFTRPDGTKVFDPAAGLLKVHATITDGDNVDQTTVCLRAVGETGTCPHPGTNHGAGNVYDFDLPPPAGAFDGQSVPLFTISANDLFASAVPAGFQTEHQGASPVQSVAFDNTPPVVTVTPDPGTWARSGAPIDVVATVTDGSGLSGPPSFSGATASSPATTTDNVHFVLHLNPSSAPANAEGAFNFQIAAQDHLGHQTLSPVTRTIDGKPPLSTVQIFKTGDAPAPGSVGVTYPAPVANTGWTGSTFIYSDSIHVHGTITDLSGVGPATLHVDGIALAGGLSPGQGIPLTCSPAGQPTCTFDVDVVLNQVSGAFHSSGGNVTGTIPFGLDSIPAGALQVSIDAQDDAVSFTGGAAPNSGTQRTPVQTTRFLWEQTLAGTAVSGIAVHPSGDVIVTTSGAGDLYARAPDQPLVLWNGNGAATPLITGINGMPAVGSGDAATARIYVASAAGVLYAFDAVGSMDWTNSTGAPFSVGPAVASVGTPAIDEVLIPDAAVPTKTGAPVSRLWRATSATDVNSVSSDEQDVLAAPLILGGNVYFATQHAQKSTSTGMHVTMHAINPDGTLGAFTDAVAVVPPALPAVVD
ncbi:MAG TPA: hypothetical protein VFL36_05015, partial [Myxococcales bacterium]|nr:hypothetical protein [Myxococcales bacterium]